MPVMDDLGRIKPETAAEMVVRVATNAGRTDMLTFANAIDASHRSVQHQTMKMFLYVVRMWAESFDKGHYDARNEAVCKLAKKIITDNPNIFSSGEDNFPTI